MSAPKAFPRTGRRRAGAAAAVGLLAVAACSEAPQTGLPKPVPRSERADRILVEKAARRLTLWRKGRQLAAYDVALGFAPVGHKQREGDGRTPEGLYKINGRNPGSAYHLSLRVSYPDAKDRASAKARGVSPGGDIFIHGYPPGKDWFARWFRHWDWTAGCIAVTDAEIREIWARVPNGAEIEIRP